MNTKDKNINELSGKEIFKEALVDATLREFDRAMEKCKETAEVLDEYKRKMNKMFKDIGSSFIPYPDI